MAGLLVGFFDEALDGFGGGQGPKDQSFEESELLIMSVSILISAYLEHTQIYPFSWCHAGECAPTMGRVLRLPCRRPLRLMGLNGFFERTLKMTASEALRRVSLCFVFRCRL